MVRYGTDLPDCPVETTLLLIGNKWKVLIVRELLTGTRCFGDRKCAVAGISQKGLTANLRAVEQDGLLRREAFAEMPPRVDYSLTDLGQSLESVLDSLGDWGRECRQRTTQMGSGHRSMSGPALLLVRGCVSVNEHQ